MAAVSAQLSVTATPLLLWQTTDVSSSVNPSGQIFRASGSPDVVPILIENQDSTNPVWIGGSAVTSSTGLKLVAGASLAFNVLGNDSLYAVSGGTVIVGVLVQRQ